ncbi:MAG: hypothetical protein KDD50_04305 [Bdellovibrionales bacterium]|nr:hypothetical protein [Bdellovibrionales bacterium]
MKTINLLLSLFLLASLAGCNKGSKSDNNPTPPQQEETPYSLTGDYLLSCDKESSLVIKEAQMDERSRERGSIRVTKINRNNGKFSAMDIVVQANTTNMILYSKPLFGGDGESVEVLNSTNTKFGYQLAVSFNFTTERASRRHHHQNHHQTKKIQKFGGALYLYNYPELTEKYGEDFYLGRLEVEKEFESEQEKANSRRDRMPFTTEYLVCQKHVLKLH